VGVIYFAHSYRQRDARIVDYFGRLMRSEGLVPSLDPPSDAVNSAKLQRHLNSSDGMVAILSRRDGGTSPHILHEISLAIKARFPILVFVEDTLSSNVVSPHTAQQRFSYRSFLRETPSHRQALRFLKAYIPSTPPGGHQIASFRRSCVVLHPNTVPSDLADSTAYWISNSADYEVSVLQMTDYQHPWQPFDRIRAASVVVSYASPGNAGSFFAGFAAGCGVPLIELTTDRDFVPSRRLPVDYQPRPVHGLESLTTTLTTEFELFEQDFLELQDQDAVDRYATLLVDLAGHYDDWTRDAAIREVVMGDKYEVSGQAGAVGKNAQASNFTLQQAWREQEQRLDLPQLAAELETLRQELKRQATTREQDSAVAAVGAAAEAAEQGNGPEALGRLQRSGKWALDAATAIGTAVAAAAIKVSLGL
jgi:hypothetical protein